VLTLLRPEYAVVVPGPDPIAVPLVYPLARPGPDWSVWVDTWIGLKEKDDTIGQLYRHWNPRPERRPARPRWSVGAQPPPLGRLTHDHHRGRPTVAPGTLPLPVRRVRPGEGVTVLLLALNVFLILMAYYVLKPVREALILGGGSAELKSYMAAAQVVVLAFVVPLYARLVARMDRRHLINWVTGFFVACLAVFYLLGRGGVPLGSVYFLWIGIFNMMIVAQFWSFANDVYSKEEGERLFAIVASGPPWERWWARVSPAASSATSASTS